MESLRIYIHGRPQGQDVWPKNGNPVDFPYLSPFLDYSKVGEGVKSSMVIDVRGENVYYTYLRRRNVLEYGDRRGNGYFAITVGLTGLKCERISKLYGLLDLVFQKKCEGILVKENGDEERYVVDKFSDAEKDLLDDIIDVVRQNMQQVFASQLVPLRTTADTTGSTPMRYALSDVDSPDFFASSSEKTILVSPNFKSKSDSIEELKKQNSGLEMSLQQCKDKINALEKSYSSVIDEKSNLEEELRQSQQQMQLAKEECEKQCQAAINTITLEKENLQSSFNQYKKEKSDEIARLSSKIKDSKQKGKEKNTDKHEPRPIVDLANVKGIISNNEENIVAIQAETIAKCKDTIEYLEEFVRQLEEGIVPTSMSWSKSAIQRLKQLLGIR